MKRTIIFLVVLASLLLIVWLSFMQSNESTSSTQKDVSGGGVGNSAPNNTDQAFGNASTTQLNAGSTSVLFLGEIAGDANSSGMYTVNVRKTFRGSLPSTVNIAGSSCQLANGSWYTITATSSKDGSLKCEAAAYFRGDYQYVADFSDDRVLVGASHDIFVAKVLRQMGAKERGIGPETQFEVLVIENIKGDLRGNVIVDQQGGYVDGKIYIPGYDFAPTAESTSADGTLLQPGSTYIFATRYNPNENWYTLIPYPTALQLLDSNADASVGQIVSTANADHRFLELKNAYPNEELLSADVIHNNALNSYTATHPGK